MYPWNMILQHKRLRCFFFHRILMKIVWLQPVLITSKTVKCIRCWYEFSTMQFNYAHCQCICIRFSKHKRWWFSLAKSKWCYLKSKTRGKLPYVLWLPLMGTVKAQDAVEFRIVITGHETKWKMGVEYGIMAYLRI